MHKDLSCERDKAGKKRSECASRQWRRGACRCNDNITSAGLSVLWWVQHLPRRCLDRRPLPLTKNTQPKNLQRIENVSTCLCHHGYLCLSPITTLSMLLQPFLEGRSVQNCGTGCKTDHKSGQKTITLNLKLPSPDKTATSETCSPFEKQTARSALTQE